MTAPQQYFAGHASKKSRILALDVLRGTAILGMLCMNIPEMGQNISDFFSKPHAGWTTAEQALFWFREMVIEGNSRTIFTMLFGATFMLLIAGSMKPTDPVRSAELYFRRCALLAVFGVLHATLLLWPGDLLLHYAVPAALLFLFRNWDPKPLLAIVAVGICFLTVMEAREDFKNARVYAQAKSAIVKLEKGIKLSEPEEAKVEKWQEIVAARGLDKDAWAHEKEVRRSYFRSVGFMATYWWNQFDLDVLLWGVEAFVFMLFGLALFKLGIINGQRSRQFYFAMAIVGFGIAVPLNAHEAWLKWSTLDAPFIWQDDITYQISRTAMALGIIGFLIAMLKSEAGPALLRPVACAGRMALTNYLGQSAICAILFTGFGLFGKLNGFQLIGLAFSIWVCQVLFSMWWLARFTMGPLEWLWRVLIHWQDYPLRLKQPTPVTT
ncbi:MAG: DUF418 domain-containing protein [Hyphomicrobiaceae bacterium]|nr:DUF418 domain-containing protein [Hyphomicrobiaceae bacterium]